MPKMDVRPLVPSGLIVVGVEVGTTALTLTVRRPSRESACPTCGTVSRRIHSRYWRSLADLPSHGRRVQLRLEAHRFRCIDRHCHQRIFAERLGCEIASASARRTARLDSLIHHLGLALGGRPAASLARRLVLPVSKDTLLRTVRRHYRPSSQIIAPCSPHSPNPGPTVKLKARSRSSNSSSARCMAAPSSTCCAPV